VFNPDQSVNMQMPGGDPASAGGGPQGGQPSQPYEPGTISPNNMMGRSMQQATIQGPDGGGGPLG
jgi:hypothetical protein